MCFIMSCHACMPGMTPRAEKFIYSERTVSLLLVLGKAAWSMSPSYSVLRILFALRS